MYSRKVGEGTSSTYTIDFEQADGSSYAPFFTISGYGRYESQFVVPLGTVGSQDAGTWYGRRGPSNYSVNNNSTMTIDFYIPAGANASTLDFYYRWWYVQNDTVRVRVREYDSSYTTIQNTLLDLERTSSASSQKQIAWTNFNTALSADAYYRLEGEYRYRSQNPNFSERPPSGPGESVHLDAITVTVA